jgi:hypothetical protein
MFGAFSVNGRHEEAARVDHADHGERSEPAQPVQSLAEFTVRSAWLRRAACTETVS